MSLEVRQFPCLSDNYGFLVHDTLSGETATIDTPEADRILGEADKAGWRITQVWNTHWHPDHAGGNEAIVAATGAQVIGPKEVSRIAPMPDTILSDGDIVHLGDHRAKVVDVGGHTLEHIAYVFEGQATAFVGDALFALGCGRLFEGTPQQMWASLSRLKALDPKTTIYCAHEYTAANAAFAQSVDSDNAALAAYVDWVKETRAQDLPTVPTRLDKELAANPFLRADDPAMQSRMGAPGDPVKTFAELRARKDTF